MKLDVGKISYLNVYPFYENIELNNINFISGEPSFLNKKLHSGEIDLSPSSCVEYFRNPEQYFLIKDLSISSTDKIFSVILLLNKKIEEINERDIIFLNKASASSNALVKIIFAEFFKLKVEYDFSNENKLLYEKNHLLIGDKALEVYYNRPDGYYIYDLATLWYDFTKLPFVFALWIINKNSKHKARDINRFISHLYSRKKNFKIPDKYKNFSLSEIESYFKVIDYNLNINHIKSLKLFAQLCFKYEFISKIPVLRWWN